MQNRWRPVLFLLLCAVLPAAAQPPHTFTRYGRESGFSGTTVEDMAQDRHGKLWLATWRGIYSFNGRDFQNYRTGDPVNRDDPRSNRFQHIETFGDDEVLAVSYDNRLYRIDPAARSLTPVDSDGHAVQRIFRPAPGLRFFLTPDNQLLDENFSLRCKIDPDAEVRDLICDPDGQVWVLTDRGIWRDGELRSEMPAFCAVTVDEAVYIGSAGGEVLQYQDQQLTSLPTRLGTDITFLAKVPQRPELMIGSADRGIEIYDLENGSRHHLPLPGTPDEGGSFTCSTDCRGNLWIWSSRGCLYWYDQQHYLPVPFLNKNMQLDWNSESGITSFLADIQGNLWIGSTWGGLERVVFQEDNFKLKSIDGSGQASPGNSVRALAKEDSGWILAATRDARLHAFDSRMQERAVWDMQRTGCAIAKAHDGTIWIGTRGAGLIEVARPTPGNFRIRPQAYPKSDFFYGPNSNDIYSLLEDEGHRLWIGTFDEGVAYVDLDAKERMFISKKNRLSFPTDRRNRVRCLALGPDGRLYAGGQMGLFVCAKPDANPEDMHFERFSKILDYDIQHILFAADGDLYVSSFGAGLLRFDSGDADSGFSAYTTRDGMLSDYILSAVEDGSGNLWIATQDGLNRLNRQTGSLIGFPYERIGHSLRFNEGQPLRAQDGTLYFNTTAGILYFDPDEISNSDFVPEIQIESFYVSGSRKDLPETGSVRILPTDGLRVQFAALDLTAPEQILYSYRLDGRDSDWLSLDHAATLSIPPLRPGRYTLRIRSTNGDGLQVDNERSIPILVQNRFPRSGWVLPVCLTIMVILALRLVMTRIRATKKAAPEESGAEFRELHGEDRHFVDSFLELLRSRIDDSSLDVPQMYAAMNVSRSVLFAKCRALLGTTPALYLRRMRLERAQELIREGGRTMAEISYATGFNDPHYFSKIFKQEFGMTPSQYRDSVRSL